MGHLTTAFLNRTVTEKCLHEGNLPVGQIRILLSHSLALGAEEKLSLEFCSERKWQLGFHTCINVAYSIYMLCKDLLVLKQAPVGI